MTRNLKTLGLALVAVFAMSAMAAQAASAHTFTAERAPVTLTGTATANQILTAGSTNVTCTTATFTGTAASTSESTQTVTPHYTNCTLGGSEAPVDNNGCQYVFGANTHVTNHAPVSLECNHSGSITVTGPACTIHFGDTHTGGGSTVNQNLTGVKYTNLGSGSTKEIGVDPTVSGITYEGTGFGCAILGISGTKHDGAYSGSAKVTGSDATGHIGIEFS